MKYRLIIINIVLFCSFFSICSAYPNEKNVFRNLYWGESLQEVQADNDIYDLEYISYNEKNNTVIYMGKLKNSNIGIFNINNIRLIFNDNNLIKIYIDFDFYNRDINLLRYSMIKNFGEPEINIEIRKTDTIMIYDELTDDINIYSSIPSGSKFVWRGYTTMMTMNWFVIDYSAKEEKDRGVICLSSSRL